jgi:hypothetical protein
MDDDLWFYGSYGATLFALEIRGMSLLRIPQKRGMAVQHLLIVCRFCFVFA